MKNQPDLTPIMPLIDRFVDEWKDSEIAIGFLLTGSWAYGKPRENSDIDLRVVINSDLIGSEKQAYLWQGKRINSWAMSAPSISSRFHIQWKQYIRFDARCFSKGLILEDSGNTLQALKEEATEWMKRPLPRIPKQDLKLLQYGVVSGSEELKLKDPQNPFFPHQYIRSIRSIWELYQKNFGVEDVTDKFEEILTSKEIRAIYEIPELPHQEFAPLFTDASKAISNWDQWKAYDLLLSFVLSFFEPVSTSNFRLKLNHHT